VRQRHYFNDGAPRYRLVEKDGRRFEVIDDHPLRDPSRDQVLLVPLDAEIGERVSGLRLLAEYSPVAD
jgi:hypothetical protein